MESLDEIRAIRETAPQTGILYTVTDPQKLLSFGKAAGLNVLRRRGLKIGGEMPVQGAVGDEEPLAQGCDIEGRLVEMPGDIQKDLRELHRQILGTGADAAAVADQIQNAEQVLGSPKTQHIFCLPALIQTEAMLDQRFLIPV